jgi:hypothetical protein
MRHHGRAPADPERASARKPAIGQTEIVEKPNEANLDNAAASRRLAAN